VIPPVDEFRTDVRLARVARLRWSGEFGRAHLGF
jgi:hypothetical protein